MYRDVLLAGVLDDERDHQQLDVRNYAERESHRVGRECLPSRRNEQRAR